MVDESSSNAFSYHDTIRNTDLSRNYSMPLTVDLLLKAYDEASKYPHPDVYLIPTQNHNKILELNKMLTYTLFNLQTKKIITKLFTSLKQVNEYLTKRYNKKAEYAFILYCYNTDEEGIRTVDRFDLNINNNMIDPTQRINMTFMSSIAIRHNVTVHEIRN